MRASLVLSPQPLMKVAARKTFSKRSDTRSKGQNDRCSFKPIDRASWFFISLSAHVRHRCAVAGADGDWVSHFGLSSAKVAPGSSNVVMSVISKPNGSSKHRYPPTLFFGRWPLTSAALSCSLQRRIRQLGRRIRDWSTNSSDSNSGRTIVLKLRLISLYDISAAVSFRRRSSFPRNRGGTALCSSVTFEEIGFLESLTTRVDFTGLVTKR